MKGERSSAKAGMEEFLSLHDDELVAFRKARKEDIDAVRAISQAIVVLAKFCMDNKISLQLVQAKEPADSVHFDKAKQVFKNWIFVVSLIASLQFWNL